MKLQSPCALGAMMFCLSIGLVACAARAAGPSVELKGKHFDIEIAADDSSRQRGLMFRDEMPADHVGAGGCDRCPMVLGEAVGVGEGDDAGAERDSDRGGCGGGHFWPFLALFSRSVARSL